MGNVNVYQNTKEIHILIVVQNVCLAQIVLKIKLVFKENVSTLVSVPADKMQFVKLSTIFQCAAVQMDLLEMLLLYAILLKVRLYNSIFSIHIVFR